MRLAGLIGLTAMAVLLITSCGGGGDFSGKLEKSGAAGPQDPSRGDAPPSKVGPKAVEVRYNEQMDGIVTRDIALKADTTFIIILNGYASKEARERTKQRWDANLKDAQTEAIMEGCSYEIMNGLKKTLTTPPVAGTMATITVRFANGEEITVQASNQEPPPNDFRAIAHALVELAKEKVMDKSIKPTDVVL